jgi:iron complex outermembrane receptor protein
MKHYQTGIARKFLFLMVGLLCAIGANAQSITVRGTVVDPSGEPLIGASILAEGTSVGTATDIDGNYAINVNPDATLVFSYVGYDPQSVAVKGRTTIDVTMKENSVMLNEVVAIGYGVVKKSDATGSVAVVKPDEIEAGLATSVQDILVGQIPGVVVTTAGGPEGGASIRVRGGSSLNASNDPLIVLDGVPLDNGGVQGMGNPLAMISPENIESMTILKDASATAIYGARASNGVIIVTTKRGKSGKPQINFSANMYINHAHKRWDVLSADEFRNLIVERFGENSDAANALGDTSTDWQDEVLRTTVSSDYSLSIGGTAGVLPYHANISYTNSNGIIKTSKMDRLTLGFNLSPKFFQDHLSVNANVKGFYVRNQFGDAGALSSAISYDPTHPVRSDLPIVGGTSGQKYMFNGFYEVANVNSEGVVQLYDNASLNPVGMLENKDNYANVYRSNGNLQLDYSMHFLPELHANLNLGYDVSKTNETNATAANSAEAWKNHEHYGGGYKTDTYQFKSNTMLEFYLNYKKEFDAASQMVDVVGGYTWQRTYNEGHYSGANGNAGVRTSPGLNYPTLVDGKYYMDQNDATVDLVGKPFQADGISSDGNYHWKDHLQLLSFYGRVNYGLLDRYLLTFTVRGDATSRFSKNNRWGVFPAAALAWKLNNEAFLESASGWLSDLKLRLSWGQTGQQEVGSSINYMPMYAIASPSVSYPNGLGGWYLPVYARGYNPDLTWETTTTYNAALDFGFLNNRITGNIEYYHRKTTDLLAFVAVPAGSSTTNMLNRNIGSLENYGVEFNIQARPVVTKDFTWTLNYNVGWNHNEITEITGNSVFKVGGISGGNGNTVQIHAVGHPANSFYLFQQVYDENGAPLEGVYVDQNGDGQIDEADKIINKSPDPKVTMTFGSQFRWKSWDLGFNIRASIGNYVYNNVLSTKAVYNDLFAYGLNNLVKNDHYFEQPRYMSDYYLRNASFVRCDNITLGYTWDNLINDHLRLRLFGAVQNPFVITKYKGVDPEVFGGIDNSVYPRATVYSLGLVATF